MLLYHIYFKSKISIILKDKGEVNRIRTFLFAIVFWGLLVISPVFLVKYLVLKLIDREKAYLYVNRLASSWGRLIIKAGGGSVEVSGLENLPQNNRICFISNHQSYIDIPVILGWIPKPMGAVGKHSLKFVPFFNLWLKPLRVILINRKSLKQSKTVIRRGIEEIRSGHPVIIAPEGTRSRSNRMGRFKPGSFKLATESGASIVPITVDGAYRGLEEKGRISPVHIKLTVHPSLPPEAVQKMTTKELAEKTWEIINSGLEKPNKPIDIQARDR